MPYNIRVTYNVRNIPTHLIGKRCEEKTLSSFIKNENYLTNDNLCTLKLTHIGEERRYSVPVKIGADFCGFRHEKHIYFQ